MLWVNQSVCLCTLFSMIVNHICLFGGLGPFSFTFRSAFKKRMTTTTIKKSFFSCIQGKSLIRTFTQYIIVYNFFSSLLMYKFNFLVSFNRRRFHYNSLSYSPQWLPFVTLESKRFPNESDLKLFFLGEITLQLYFQLPSVFGDSACGINSD